MTYVLERLLKTKKSNFDINSNSKVTRYKHTKNTTTAQKL